MNKEAVFIPHKRKYLFCADQQGMKLLSDVIEQVKRSECSYDLFVFEGDPDWKPFFNFLKKQKMGTYLYVALNNQVLGHAQTLAEEIGFSAEEAQYVVYGEVVRKIFCCRCHGINEAKEKEIEITCEQCGLVLSISDHYSTHHHAFLGYVAKL
ncbi:hypothetical protein KUV80_16025 [Fictibacillus nanhaiensis]|uniref:dimethylamine monooxygenase subunit DmmA family protein n=1 Tax=Fictibacillus nanhaiensis TaxID=742169 RepID=UPI001C939571|nr:dimethylamine monooxygenase subunit DmmA family protein [Fictibacillus nanhaiensis]MBY6038168.1 hypothetical protein [Fictibacillus nanhaiensis]